MSPKYQYERKREWSPIPHLRSHTASLHQINFFLPAALRALLLSHAMTYPRNIYCFQQAGPLPPSLTPSLKCVNSGLIIQRHDTMHDTLNMLGDGEEENHSVDREEHINNY